MELILWRHADAKDAAPGKPDAERGLTAKGIKQARRMADWLEKRLPAEARVLVSPARRAQQTAALAVTGRTGDWSVKKGAIWRIESRGRGEAVVRAVIAPDLLI